MFVGVYYYEMFVGVYYQDGEAIIHRHTPKECFLGFEAPRDKRAMGSGYQR